jgi:hypothetical protein
MNHLEQHMVDLLLRARHQYGVVAVKAEFEAEGTRPDEFLCLLKIANRAGLRVALKIGGCEAVSDLIASKLYGVDYIIAPMIESRYALTKYIEARNKVYGSAAQTGFLFNLETDTALRALPEMLPDAMRGVDGIVFGRVDFTLSRGMPRNAINDRSITNAVVDVAKACVDTNLELVVGGSVAVEAIESLREIRSVRLDRFETRKVVFDGSAIESDNIDDGIAIAAEFELAWLKNKRDYYATIAAEDESRIGMMEARLSAADAARPRLLKSG